jgi:hypothetical protein
MKALINPLEITYQITAWELNGAEYVPTQTQLGYRVCEVNQNSFDVAEPLFWVDCQDELLADNYFFDINTKELVEKPLDVDCPRPEPKTKDVTTI